MDATAPSAAFVRGRCSSARPIHWPVPLLKLAAVRIRRQLLDSTLRPLAIFSREHAPMHSSAFSHVSLSSGQPRSSRRRSSHSRRSPGWHFPISPFNSPANPAKASSLVVTSSPPAPAAAGYWALTFRTYPAEIKGGPCMFQVRIGADRIKSIGNAHRPAGLFQPGGLRPAAATRSGPRASSSPTPSRARSPTSSPVAPTKSRSARSPKRPAASPPRQEHGRRRHRLRSARHRHRRARAADPRAATRTRATSARRTSHRCAPAAITRAKTCPSVLNIDKPDERRARAHPALGQPGDRRRRAARRSQLLRRLPDHAGLRHSRIARRAPAASRRRHDPDRGRDRRTRQRARRRLHRRQGDDRHVGPRASR